MISLVTGATGFLGATLARRLLLDGVRLRCMKRAGSRLDLLQDVASDIEWVTGDVLDTLSLEKALSGVSLVYHTAAYLGFDGKRDRSRLMRTNVVGTANVVDAAVAEGVERLVHTSSIAALTGSPDTGDCLDETAGFETAKTRSAYGLSKYRSELEVHRAVAEGLDAVLVNPSLIMGVGRPGENTMLLVEKVNSEKLPFVPSGSTNVVDVLDVADGHVRAMESGATGERYLLVGDNLSWSSLIRTLATALGVRAPSRTIGARSLAWAALVFETASRAVGRRPLITREAARLSSSVRCYSNDKAIRELGCSFRPFAETAGRIADEVYGDAIGPVS